MGIIRSPFLYGRPSGSVGPICYRTIAGKLIASIKPTTYRIPQDEKSLAIRKKFKFFHALGKTIYNVLCLNSLWKKAGTGRSASQNFMQQNYKRLLTEFGVERLHLTPEGRAFGISSPEIVIAANSVTLNTDPLGSVTDIVPAVETKLNLNGLMLLSNPIDAQDAAYQVISLESAQQNTDLVNPLVFEAPITGSDSLLIAAYQDKKVVCNLTTRDAVGTVIRGSVTVSN